MRKLFLVTICLFTFFAVFGQNFEKYEVKGSSLNVRSEASSDGEIVGKLTKKQEIQVSSFDGDWAEIQFINEDGESVTGFVKSEFIQKPTIENSTPNSSSEVVSESGGDKPSSTTKDSEPVDNTVLYVILVIFLFFLICYIVAIVRTKNGQMYAFANWWDFILVIVTGIAITISAYFYLDNATDTAEFWISLIVAVSSLSGTLILSIKINSGNLMNIVLSIFAKIFVFIAIGFIALVYLVGRFWRSANENALSNPNSTSSVHSDLRGIEQGEKMMKASGWLAGTLLLSLIAVQWTMPQPLTKIDDEINN